MNSSFYKSNRQALYFADSKIDKDRLRGVKLNLYEATTKVILHSIEMYTKLSLKDWVEKSLFHKMSSDKYDKSLKKAEADLRAGNLSALDITHGVYVIENYIRGDVLKLSYNDLHTAMKLVDKKLGEIEEQEKVIDERKKVLEERALKLREESSTKDDDEIGVYVEIEGEVTSSLFSSDNEESTEEIDDNSNYENDDDYDEDDEEDEDESDIHEEIELTPLEQYVKKINAIENIEELDDEIEVLNREIELHTAKKNELLKLDKEHKGGKLLEEQNEREIKALQILREIRNNTFAHSNEDIDEISAIGTWVPDAGKLYQWGNAIVDYLKTIDKRYQLYSVFDSFYSNKEGKDKFEEYNVFVKRQIQELYVNRSSIVFEFAGQLYDRDDEEYNFKNLIENMAKNWDTGIRCFAIVKNEDLPELNIFFKACLGTNRYVDSYLVDRNALREAYKKKEEDSKDYEYFKLIYNLNPSMDKIYWKGIDYTMKDFAEKVLYKLVKAYTPSELRKRFNNENAQYTGDINFKKMCEAKLLSQYYFKGLDNLKGMALAESAETAVLQLDKKSSLTSINSKLYKTTIRSLAKLYFFMLDEPIFSYTWKDKTFHWHSFQEAAKYLEKTRNFASFEDLSEFIDKVNKSPYFNVWREAVIIKSKEVNQEVL